MLTAAEWSALAISLRVATWSLAIMLIPGIACAWLLARKRFPGKALLDALIHLPLVLPPVVVGYALLLLLGRGNALGRWLESTFGLHIAFTWYAAVLASAVMGFPLLVRTARLAIEMVDTRLEDAARTLGSNTLRVFFTVTLPIALPGVMGGAVLALARGLGEFGATITFAGNIEGQTRTLPLAVFTFTQTPGGDAAAMRMVIISVIVSLAALIAAELLNRRLIRLRSEAAAA
jgi:molybdate transport system permease protein